ncbi:hypothetical protein FRB99_001779, partial [Tulasnella sp. 403]
MSDQWILIDAFGIAKNILSTIYGFSKDSPSATGTTLPYSPFASFYPYTNYAIQGASFLPRPDQYTALASASQFVTGGGGWKNDGYTLPGTLSIHNLPYSANCYGLESATLIAWIQDFQSSYFGLTS